MKRNYNVSIFLFVILGVICFLSVGYSSFESNLLIDSIALDVRIEKDIRITNISLSSSNDATSHYEEYNVSNISSGVSLPKSSSSVTYLIEVTNYGNVDMGILNISNLPSNLEYELKDYKLKEKLCDSEGVCKLGSKSKFYLTIKYKDGKYDSKNIDFNFSLSFDFRPFYIVTYQNFDNITNYPSEVIESGTLRIDFSKDSVSMINVEMNNSLLTMGANYDYSNYVLTLNDVLGPVHIIHIEGRKEVSSGYSFVKLNSNGHSDDHYLFAGEVYYLNPYDLSMECDSSNYVSDANSNPNQCMKWYQIGEDDEFITLMLNSNIGDPIEDASDITLEANTYLKTFTDLWDDRLLLSDNLIIDNYDYTNHKARMITMDEISYVLEKLTWSVDDYAVAIDHINKYSSYLFENLNMESWKKAGYFTSTVGSDSKNFAFNKGGLDMSVADGYTHGVRPVIEVRKEYLSLDREWMFSNQDVTYLSSTMVSSSSRASGSSLEYHVKTLRAAGIKKAYLNVGHLELLMEEGNIILDDTISSFLTSYESNIARFIKLGKKYGIEIIPWLNFPMEKEYLDISYSDNLTFGEYTILKFKEIITNILNNGFYCEDDGNTYYVTEIHLDAEPMNSSYQDYYLELVKGIDSVIGNKANFSVASPAIDYFSSSYIQTLASYVNGFNIMIYDSNGPEKWDEATQSKDEYIKYIKNTIQNYSNALSYYKTEFYALGGMYDDLYYVSTSEGWPDISTNKIYTHLNFYNGEEIETLGNLVDTVKELNDSRLNGIGFYNWEGFISYHSDYNNGSYITDDYNYITVRKDYLKEWAYLK